MEALDGLIRTNALPASYRQMVDRIHRPVADRIARTRRSLGRPVVAGLCGSQGSGKSTMAAFLKTLLEERGLKVAVLSIDDLYLTLPERERLAVEVHPLLKTRGVPGTHDVGLGHALIDVLSDGAAEVSMPRFDKAEDTRAAADAWPRVISPVDVILLEGWCVGAAPQAEAALLDPVNALERDEDAGGTWRRYVNQRLASDYAGFFGRIDILALLKAPSFEVVYGWRSLQEDKLASRVRLQGLTGTKVMDAAQIRRFLMFYERLTEWILEEMPGRADILMPLDEDHRILGVEFR
ncbi:MAG TPA: kinase [Caulobacteraceae bacterium]|jgi:D-glycerate 3-kinase